MKVSRIELADYGSPEKIVGGILAIETDLSAPVPLEELCFALDINQITDLTTEGFEGALITDEAKSRGVILARTGTHSYRRRFSIAHELGHFLLPTHLPRDGGQFLCSREDMNTLASKEANRRQKMEHEANRFAATLLMPPPLFRVDADHSGDPDITRIIELSRKYEVSKEALARWYIQFRAEPCAVVISHGDKIIRHYPNKKFPYLEPSWGSKLPSDTLKRMTQLVQNRPSPMLKIDASDWISLRWGEKTGFLYEQVELQREGYGLILLHSVELDEDDAYEEEEIRRRWDAPKFRKR